MSGDTLAPVVLVGNLSLLGIGWFQFITANATIGVLAQLGAVILLFEVGLESTVRDMIESRTARALRERKKERGGKRKDEGAKSGMRKSERLPRSPLTRLNTRR